jgi:dipeptidyl aminopeptidase/acylaminoacyl peptidase
MQGESSMRNKFLIVLTATVALPLGAQTAAKPTIAQYIGTSEPLEVVSALKTDRIAWVAYDRGMRNVYTAAAPDFKVVRLTNFMEDNGVDMTELSVSADGSTAVFVRGGAANRQGWIADPGHDPAGGDRAIWAVRTTGGAPAIRVAEGQAPTVSPDGKWVLYVKDNEIYRARTTKEAPPTRMDTGGIPFIKLWGSNGQPHWSPDGTKIVFVSARENHALIGLYDVKTRKVTYVSPSVDCDVSPTWSPDSKQIAFMRRPGTPFGLQTQQGNGGIGNPGGVASAAAAGRGGAGGAGCAAFGGRGGGGGGGGGGRGGRGGAAAGAGTTADRAGLFNATFKGGYTLSMMVADVATGKIREFWHNEPGDRLYSGISNIRWAGESVIFPLVVPNDEWDRYYAINVAGTNSTPVQLTTTNGLIEDATSVSLSPDGKTLYYCTNANDIERRHIWAVSTSGGTPRQVSTGDGVERDPVPLASGKKLAVLYFNAAVPASVAMVNVDGSAPKVIYPKLGKDFPAAEHVMPQIILTKAADGLEIHNQLFLPKDLKPGEKRPTMIFVHGGPAREMLPAYHYMQFYHWAYAFNQWLADEGYIVLSINYRTGVGYGRSFRQAPNTEARGNSEYQDVLAGAHYLQSRPDVDATRLGIWGLSYGGLLTSEALARNSDIFVAGVDLAGVHLYGQSLADSSLSYRSSAISAINTWKSPVFLLQGDDDRNVDFSQMIGLVDLLRAHGVYYELTVIPDDQHESMIHSNWVRTFGAMGDFLHRFVWEKQAPPAN